MINKYRINILKNPRSKFSSGLQSVAIRKSVNTILKTNNIEYPSRRNLRVKILCLTMLLFLSLLPNLLYAQKNIFQFERISVEQGLSQSGVHCILQDRKGFMWFGTGDGLNKYDGYNFTVIRNDSEDPPDESFLLTYNDRLNMNQLERLISLGRFREQKVELLTLSACQTALGNERAAMGTCGRRGQGRSEKCAGNPVVCG